MIASERKGILMKKIVMLTIIAVLSLGLLTACGGGAADVTINVDMGVDGAYDFDQDVYTVKKGQTVDFVLHNRDTAQNHNFMITDLNVKTPQVTPGKTHTVQVKATKAGDFQIFCDVPGHKEGGMVATLRVTE
jgi:uncharacterized cupredoxin-like copper-binding protein